MSDHVKDASAAGQGVIRNATIADIPALTGIAHRTWPEAYKGIIPDAQIAYMLETRFSESALKRQFGNGHRFLVAVGATAVVGLAGYEHGARGTSHTRLHKLYVLPSAQGSGLGAALLQRVEEDAREAGDAFVELNVNKRNPALDLYRNRGYTVLRDEMLDIGHGFVMDDHVLIKELR